MKKMFCNGLLPGHGSVLHDSVFVCLVATRPSSVWHGSPPGEGLGLLQYLEIWMLLLKSKEKKKHCNLAAKKKSEQNY